MSLEIDELLAAYGTGEWALGPLSFRTQTNNILGLVGPNGAGKSTLFKALVGGVQTVDGSARLDGKDLVSLASDRRARRQAYLEQNPSIAFDFMVRDVVSMSRYAWSDQSPETVSWALDAVGLADCADNCIHTLSGGQRRRVYLARVLAQEPRLLLLDEPTPGLDVKYTWQLPDLLQEARFRFGELTVVWALHDLELASRVCDRLLLLADGKIYKGPAVPAAVLTAESLKDVYDVEASVRPDRAKGGVRILPANRRNQRKLQSMMNS